MPLGIGNNLIRNGGVLNPDGLSLDLQFAADKTFSKPSSLAAGETAITSRRGPSATFLRSTAATEVGPDGLIRYAPENLSPSFTSYAKVQLQTPTSISDGITADSLRYTPTGTSVSYMFTSFTFVQGTLLTLSCFIRSSSLTAVNFRDFAGIAKNSRSFDPTTGLWATSGGDTQFTSYSVSSLNNGWYRISCNYLPTDTTNSRFFGIMLGQNSATSVDLGGIQIERHPTARTYIPTTTAAVYAPRFDHDPVTLACKGLLIEEGRTNLFSSTNLNDWSASRCTKTPITGIGLTNQASTFTVSEIGSIYTSRVTTLTTGVAHAISVRVKAGTVASFNFGDLTDGKYSRGFNLSTNQWAASGGSVEFTNYTVTPNIDGWFLVSAIYTPTGATGGKAIAFLLGGTTLGQTVSFDTPQLEVGSFPTSFIPTTTGTLARSADVCNITGGDFNNFYNQSEGTLFADVSGLMPDVLGGNRGLAVITDGTYNNQIGIYKVASVAFIGAAGNTGNVSQFTLNNAYVPFTQYKVALGVKTNDTNAAFNGSLKTTDTSVTLPSTMNRLEFRDATGAAGGQPSCHLAAIRYYKKRLPNAKLVTLTT